MNEYRVEQKRKMISEKIQRNPFNPRFIKRQFYSRSSSGEILRDGDPIEIPGFVKPVRIFENVKIENVANEIGIQSPIEGTFILAEYDEIIEHGMMFDYQEKSYMIKDRVLITKYGATVGIRGELLDITEKAVYAD